MLRVLRQRSQSRGGKVPNNGTGGSDKNRTAQASETKIAPGETKAKPPKQQRFRSKGGSSKIVFGGAGLVFLIFGWILLGSIAINAIHGMFQPHEEALRLPPGKIRTKKRPSQKMKKLSPKRIVFLSGYNDFVDSGNIKGRRVRAISSKAQKALEKEYSIEEDALLENPLETFETEECKAMKEWQMKSFPTCNSMHELDLKTIEYKASGGRNDVWKLTDDLTDTAVAVKTMQIEQQWNVFRVWRWNIDSLVLERLTSSPHISTMYGYCGFSGLHEFSNYPSLKDQIDWQREHGGYPDGLDTTQLLRNAVDVTRGVADLHTFDGDYATVGHADLAYDQYIFVEGVYKLTDFNWAFLLRWNKELKKVCPVPVHVYTDTMAPEEYRSGERTEKADVFSLGYVLYNILTGLYAFDGVSGGWKKVARLLSKGKRPHISKYFLSSQDPVHIALLAAIRKCWVEDPIDRSSATEVLNGLTEALAEIENERDSHDGLRWVGTKW